MATAIAATATYAGRRRHAFVLMWLHYLSHLLHVYLLPSGSALGFVVGPAIVGNPTNQTGAEAAINNLYYYEAAA